MHNIKQIAKVPKAELSNQFHCKSVVWELTTAAACYLPVCVPPDYSSKPPMTRCAAIQQHHRCCLQFATLLRLSCPLNRGLRGLVGLALPLHSIVPSTQHNKLGNDQL